MNKPTLARENDQRGIAMDAAASQPTIRRAAPGAAKPQSFGRQEMTIKADLSRLAEVRRFADRACRAYGFPPDASYQVKLAMSEAVANAIEHGSTTADDPIRLQVVHEGDALAFYVSDGGTFIEPSMVYDRDVMDERGRGLGFIELLMDDVSIDPSPEGTVIRFAKRLGTYLR
jgi:serine/threonine-protein kinase RsbW